MAQPRASSRIRISKASAIYSSGVSRLRERAIAARDLAVPYFGIRQSDLARLFEKYASSSKSQQARRIFFHPIKFS
jgi:hypothetical protein